MTGSDDLDLDRFPSGLLITDSKWRIVYANRYFEARFGIDAESLRGTGLVDLLSRASAIMFESYVLPLLLHERKCEEIQLVMLDTHGAEIPVIINAIREDEDSIYWAIYSSTRRDKLYQDLVDARRSLEEKAAQLETLSATDELTGLLNRRELLRQSQSIVAGANRNQRPLSILILDIDYFKAVNDRWGHVAGDRVLEEFGRVLKQYGRASDIIARFGGDEFVCLLPDTDIAAAQAFANRLLECVNQIEHDDFGVTVSIGLAMETGEIDFERLFRKADKALYKAKASGRNNSSVAPSGNGELDSP